jgi:hypothetical protein
MKPGAGLLCCALLVCVCGGALAQGSVKDLIGLAKAKPGELNLPCDFAHIAIRTRLKQLAGERRSENSRLENPCYTSLAT